MSENEKLLSESLLKSLFTYREDGFLVWNYRPRSSFEKERSYLSANANVGKVAGYFNKRTDSKKEGFGYWKVNITIDGKPRHYKLHRLIFMYHNGYLPEVVDHKDCNTQNNRIENLRDSDPKSNSKNISYTLSNTTGFKGVSYSNAKARRNKPYRVNIESDGYSFGLGSYSDPVEGANAYNHAAKLLHKDFANLNIVDVEYPIEHFKDLIFFKEYYDQILNGTFDWDSKKKRK